MQDLDRSRRLKQLTLFDPPRVLPSWKELPQSVRQTVTELLARMLRDHQVRSISVQEKGGKAHE